MAPLPWALSLHRRSCLEVRTPTLAGAERSGAATAFEPRRLGHQRALRPRAGAAAGASVRLVRRGRA